MGLALILNSIIKLHVVTIFTINIVKKHQIWVEGGVQKICKNLPKMHKKGMSQHDHVMLVWIMCQGKL